MEDQFPTERAEVPGRFEPWAKITNNRTTADIGITNILMSAKPGFNGFFNYWPLVKRLNTISPAELEAERRLAQWFKVIDSVSGSISANGAADEPRGGCLVSFKGQVATLQHCSASRSEDYLRPYKFRCSSDKVRIDDIVCDQGVKLDVSRYPYIYVPYCSDNLDKSIISALTDYVEAGGRLIIESTSGFWSSDASKVLQSSFNLPEVRPTGLKGATPMETAAWSKDTPIQSGSLSFRTQEFKPPLDNQPTAWIHNIPRAYLRPYRLCGTVPADAKVIATYADQSPAAVLIKKGKGEVLYFCGIVNWLECPGFVQALDHWGLRKTGGISLPTTPELFSTTLNKGTSIYIVGRRFIGHDDILKLRNVVAKDEPGSAQKMTIAVAGEQLKARSYHVRELMDGTDLGVLPSDRLNHDGLSLNLRPGQGFLLELQAK